jgi:hypothetical protein
MPPNWGFFIFWECWRWQSTFGYTVLYNFPSSFFLLPFSFFLLPSSFFLLPPSYEVRIVRSRNGSINRPSLDSQTKYQANPGPTIDICSACHRQIHSLFDNKHLAQELNSLDKLKNEPQLQKFLLWVQKQKPDKKIQVRGKKLK